MSEQPIDRRIIQPTPVAADAEEEPTFPRYDGPAVLSYGFRPLFFSASLFAGLAVPLWVWLYAAGRHPGFLYPPREWHVHEMLFGFLPAVIAGFLLTAVPNWTGRLPLRGRRLVSLLVLWLAGRLVVAWPWPSVLAAAMVDSAFLVALASFLWWELAAGRSWGQAPIGVIISLYALTNVLFHWFALRGAATDVPERIVLSLIMLLLTLIGGRVTPNFTREFLIQARVLPLPAAFSRFDGLSIGLVAVAAVVWVVQPESIAAGWMLVVAGAMQLIRLSRWHGWLTYREPLVLVLHAGYGWLALSLLALGGALLGIGLSPVNAVHALTTGAVGTMTLAVMTRASLGHTGRPKHAGSVTVAIYLLVNLGAVLRIFVPSPDAPTSLTHLMLAWAAVGWSGSYLLFALTYGPLLFRPSLDE